MSRGTSEDDATRTRLDRALARFDRANAEDPNREIVEGLPEPKELVYARRMTAWLRRLESSPPEPLELAVRCQHIRRWTIPRTAFSPGREGYRSWRTRLARFHAETAAAILREVGYDKTTIARVEALVRKERLKADPDTQLLEDVACLVFLEHYLTAFVADHDEAKVVEILRKTWRKMSDRGRATALGLDLPPEVRTLVERAVA